MDQGIGEFLRKNAVIVLIFLIGVSLLGIGAFQMFQDKNTQVVAIENTVSPIQKPKTIVSVVYADIEGGVLKPGVYKLPRDSRIKDLLDKAGGLSQDADTDLVAKTINLAQKITDGEKVYFPRLTDQQTVVGGSSDQNKISINTASVADLEALPGIGIVTAGKIISGRPYQSINELVSKKILTQTVFDKVKDMVVAY